MKLSFCTVTYASCASWIPAYTMEETIRRLSGIGYHYLEIVTAAPHAWPYYLDGKGRATIRESMKKYDMKASAIMPYTGGGPGGNPASLDVEEWKWTVQYLKDVVDLAADLDCHMVPFMAGWNLFGQDKERAWENSRICLQKTALYAEHKGIKISLVPALSHSGIVDTPEDTWRMKRESGQENVVLGFDVMSAFARTQDPADYIYSFGKALEYLHVCDFERGVPGTKGADFEQWKTALDKVGYSGFATIEIGADRSVCADSAARQSLEFMKKWED